MNGLACRTKDLENSFVWDHNLYQVMRDRQTPFTEREIRSLMSQVLQGLAYMHKNGYFHRDLKPDMWAVGAILAELFMLSPLLPGERCKSMYFPVCSSSSLCSVYDNFVFYLMKKFQPANLSDIIPNASLEAIDLILQLCSWDPQRRPTAEQSLQHPFFHVMSQILDYIKNLFALLIFVGDKPKLELNLWDFGTESDDCFLGLTLAVKPSIPDRVHACTQTMQTCMQEQICMITKSIHMLSSDQPSFLQFFRMQDFLFYTRYQDHSSQSGYSHF
ncbi:hypothetical protein GW17_00046418 [Ensete ventricosum]|uniref:Uncharacterized protein n=1 Tax=Ensete ventricosum TaxID=4639 RepID=A0A426ZBD4_ENSVE|nr:hypothetical protein B296_00042087 [Ensete ventricosum]RWV91302.1 hypothetical protein GW17_00046418 [Ensete ventricosum]RZS10802.1 hypothetical protein BHM03_00042069 [Ensete ventricosum]